MIKTLVCGYGYWGRILTTNMLLHSDYFISGVFDPDPNARAAARTSNLYTFHTLDDALNATIPNLVVVATPIENLVETSLTALSRYANVMIAKPGPVTTADADRIDALAKRKNRIAIVDYTMTIAHGYDQLRSEIDAFDDIREIRCVRHARGSRSNANIIHDLASHDLSLIIGLDDSREWSIIDQAITETTAKITLASGNVHAYLDISTEAIIPIRSLTVSLHDRDIVWDQLRESADAGPVWNRLNEVSFLIDDGYYEQPMMRRVAELLEDLA